MSLHDDHGHLVADGPADLGERIIILVERWKPGVVCVHTRSEKGPPWIMEQIYMADDWLPVDTADRGSAP
jgi:hypothetical protein